MTSRIVIDLLKPIVSLRIITFILASTIISVIRLIVVTYYKKKDIIQGIVDNYVLGY
jgi:hypothetical protein